MTTKQNKSFNMYLIENSKSLLGVIDFWKYQFKGSLNIFDGKVLVKKNKVY